MESRIEVQEYIDSLIKLQLFRRYYTHISLYMNKKELWKNTSYENVICAEKKYKKKERKKAIKCKIIKKSQKLSAVLHDSRSGERKSSELKSQFFCI